MSTQRAALVIEDDDDIRRLLEIVLQQSGFSVTSTNTGAAGLELARGRDHFDLVTVDAGLPDIDGTDLVRTLRGEAATERRHGRIAIISARSTPADQSKGLDAGADAYFTKPFRPSKLRAALEDLLERPDSEW